MTAPKHAYIVEISKDGKKLTLSDKTTFQLTASTLVYDFSKLPPPILVDSSQAQAVNKPKTFQAFQTFQTSHSQKPQTMTSPFIPGCKITIHPSTTFSLIKIEPPDGQLDDAVHVKRFGQALYGPFSTAFQAPTSFRLGDLKDEKSTNLQRIYTRMAMYYKLIDEKLLDPQLHARHIQNLVTAFETWDELVYNPYLAEKHLKHMNAGVSPPPFEIVDALAAQVNASLEVRTSQNIRFRLTQVMASGGHTCYPMDKLIYITRNMLAGHNAAIRTNEDLIECIMNTDFKIVSAHGADDSANNNNTKLVYLPRVYEKERQVANMLQEYVIAAADRPHAPLQPIEELILAWEETNGQNFTNNQKQCLINILSGASDVFLLTGYPGTGKSSVIKCLSELWNEMGVANKALILAPTGKAAMRLGKDAMTIHRYLYAIKFPQQPVATDFKPVHPPPPPGLIIVDETSMVDLSLMHDLLTTVHTFNPRPRLLFMGDQNQLQSVSYGSVLKHMIDSGVIDHIHLKKIFRQDQKKSNDSNNNNNSNSEYGITDLAMDVLKGHLPAVMTEFASTTDSLKIPANINTPQVQFRRESRSAKIYELLIKLYDEFMGNVQILIPMKRGVIGTMDVNELMHKHIFKTDDPKFVAGEKVVCTTNAYARNKETGAINIDQSIFNGETGTFQNWSGKGKMKIHISPPANKTVEVDAKIIEMGYALTVHKSQGSEYEYVIVLVNKSFGQMLTRNLLYTAVTRAKKKVVVIYDDVDVLHQCIKTKGAQRYSQLAHMIADAFEQ